MCGEPIKGGTASDEKGPGTRSSGEKGKVAREKEVKVGQPTMSETAPTGLKSRSVFRKKIPAAITRRLSAAGYKIERGYVNFPTLADVWAALESDEALWIYQCWRITRKTRQRARQTREAPTD